MPSIPHVFTQSAMKALVLAQTSAAMMQQERMGSAHLLIGLCKCGDDLSQLLSSSVVKADLEEAVNRACNALRREGAHLNGMSPHAHRILLRATTYASPERRALAGTAHLWLELLHEDGCMAHAVLSELGLSIEELKTSLKNAAGEITRTEHAQNIPSSNEPLVVTVVHTKGASEKKTDSAADPLETYARNLTKLAAEHQLEPLIGRQAEINSMVRILGKKTKNNPMLIGEPGVGKSALVEGLAQRIADGTAPEMLKDACIYALDLAQMVAGTKYRGEFEERVKRVLEAAQHQKNAVLFIDEMHTLIGAGGSEGSLDAANILKPALARGQIRVIGATTHNEYRKYVEKDPALARRFQRIDVAEPDQAQTLDILYGLRSRFETFHQVRICDKALQAAVDWSERFVTDRFMPDKAIDLIDEAAAMVKISSATKPNDVPEQGEYKPAITAKEIAKVVSDWTGIPQEHILSSGQSTVTQLEERLAARVLGQEQAISHLSKAIRRAQAGLNDPDRPLGVFMLLGPSGVGKTELCKALSETLFSRKDALIRVDMSEYSEEASASRLVGSPPGYVGHGEGGQLTDAVLKRPYSVVLFDEIEKAHPKIFNLLLQLLDDGQLTDSMGRCVNFKNTIIVMTSNAGISFDMNKQVGFAQESQLQQSARRRKEILDKVKQTFRPEFLGRIDEMIVMNALSEETGVKIAVLLLDRIRDRLHSRRIDLRYTQDVPAYLAKVGIDPMSGARNLRRVIQEEVENPLSDLLLSDVHNGEILLSVQEGEISVQQCSMLLE